MGCGPSKLLDTPEDFAFFNLTYHWVDTITVIHAQPRSLTLCKKAISAGWKQGIGSNFLNKGAVDYEMKGRPFVRGTSKDELTQVKRMAINILEYQLADGWCLYVSADMSRMIDQTTLFFKNMPERAMGKSAPAQITSFSFMGTDDIHLVKVNDDLVDAVKACIKEKYPKGVVNAQDMHDGTYVIKMNHHPWTSEGQVGMDARRMFCEVLRRYQKLGYHFYGTCNIYGSADCCYFVKHPDGNGWMKECEYACMSLNDHDKVRFIDLPNAVVRELKATTLAVRGADAIQREEEHFGSPWCAEAQDVIISRLYIARLMETLHEQGWEIHSAVDMSRKLNDKAVFILRDCAPSKRDHFCIAPGETDKLRVINYKDTKILDCIRDSINQYYLIGLARENENFYGAHEFKLKGQPWYGRQGNDEVFGRSFFTFLLRELEKIGWVPLVATDISARHIRSENGPDYPLDTHSWFFGAKK